MVNNNNLRTSGRLTPARNAICSFLKNHQEPVDYEQILAFLKKHKLRVNKTTVYRQLDSLLKEGLIQELDFGEGKKRYEMKQEHHHHHLLCTNCHKVECVDIKDDFHNEEKKILRNNNFKVKSHVLEFFGICGNCQEKNK